MLKLGVNIDHVATLREARYRGRVHGEPDPVEAALICESAGAHGITAHLREDRRHIQDRDVWKLREVIKTRLNLEMANTPEILGIALKLKPDIVCIVPERRQEITTEGGLDVVGQLGPLAESRKRLNDAGIAVSLFIAPDPAQIEAAARKPPRAPAASSSNCTPARLPKVFGCKLSASKNWIGSAPGRSKRGGWASGSTPATDWTAKTCPTCCAFRTWLNSTLGIAS